MKTVFSGSAWVAAALLFGSLVLSARPSIAETLISQSQKQVAQTSQSHQPSQAQQLQPASQTQQPTQKREEGPSSATGVSETRPLASTGSSPASSPAAGTPAAASASSPNVSAETSENLEPGLEPTTHYIATAYSLRGRTASGRFVSKGMIAADPRLLPLGSRVRLESGGYEGEYLVADTGGAIRGKRIDIWIPSAREALRFGRRIVKLTILSYGPKRAATSKSWKKLTIQESSIDQSKYGWND
jgi:3D (Asp-Asp-Asp) domain-containing protein